MENFPALSVDDSSFQMVTQKKTLRLELNFELEKEKPYIQAIFQDEPKTQEKHVKRALVYLQKYGKLYPEENVYFLYHEIINLKCTLTRMFCVTSC